MKMAGSMYELGSYLPSSFTTTCHDSIACIPTPSHHGSGLGRGTVKRSGEGLADQEARWEVDLSPVGDTIVEAEVWPETQQRVPVVRQVAHGGAWSLQEMNGGIAGGTRAEVEEFAEEGWSAGEGEEDRRLESDQLGVRRRRMGLTGAELAGGGGWNLAENLQIRLQKLSRCVFRMEEIVETMNKHVAVIDKQMEEVKEIAKDMGEVIDVIENLP
ncbi:hypothetical protein E3N88_15661 [Mikania micrantha]|uniref:Uncharacterized protein n=1 Tax=Mikania micrantha TaxID=192012 RepID=A0A5N6NXV3_9ASTR|nr:hypothetical protein E3N88_15661 [Mikania micrantha]